MQMASCSVELVSGAVDDASPDFVSVVAVVPVLVAVALSSCIQELLL
jgi:hypothetical protein